MWPTDASTLEARQRQLAAAPPEPWRPGDAPLVAACWVCFRRGATGRGSAGEPCWAAAVVMSGGRVVARCTVTSTTGAPYAPGLLALRTGPVLERAVRGIGTCPDVLLLDATGRDHPRGAGLALHLGAELDLPTVGVTHRPLVADGPWPADRRGSSSPLRLGDAVVGCWLRTQPGVRPLAVHPGWRTDLPTAAELVLALTRRWRTPEPLRRARQLARRSRNTALHR
jgi:deoxyribonuclease V